MQPVHQLGARTAAAGGRQAERGLVQIDHRRERRHPIGRARSRARDPHRAARGGAAGDQLGDQSALAGAGRAGDQHAQPAIRGDRAREPGVELRELRGAADQLAAALEPRAIALVEAPRAKHLDHRPGPGRSRQLAQRVQAAGQPARTADEQRAIWRRLAGQRAGLVDRVGRDPRAAVGRATHRHARRDRLRAARGHPGARADPQVHGAATGRVARHRRRVERPAHRDRHVVLAGDLQAERDDQAVGLELEHHAAALVGERAEALRHRAQHVARRPGELAGNDHDAPALGQRAGGHLTEIVVDRSVADRGDRRAAWRLGLDVEIVVVAGVLGGAGRQRIAVVGGVVVEPQRGGRDPGRDLEPLVGPPHERRGLADLRRIIAARLGQQVAEPGRSGDRRVGLPAGIGHRGARLEPRDRRDGGRVVGRGLRRARVGLEAVERARRGRGELDALEVLAAIAPVERPARRTGGERRVPRAGCTWDGRRTRNGRRTRHSRRRWRARNRRRGRQPWLRRRDHRVVQRERRGRARWRVLVGHGRAHRRRAARRPHHAHRRARHRARDRVARQRRVDRRGALDMPRDHRPARSRLEGREPLGQRARTRLHRGPRARRRELRTGPALPRLARQGDRDRVGHLARHARVQVIDPRRLGAPHRFEDRLEIGAAVQRLAGQQLPRDDAEREHVGRDRGALADRLLGRHVTRLAPQPAALERRGERSARDPEVEDLDVALDRQHHVRR